MSYFCERCWAPKLQLESGRNDYGPYICNSCSRNPKYKNHYIDFPVTCKFNYDDCVYDPGYILAYHPEQYKKKWGDRHYREVAKEACKNCTEEYCNYDYEEK